MASGARPRILGLAGADPYSPTALSGAPRHLLDAIDRRFPVVARVDYGSSGAVRLALAAATVRPSRSRWLARFHTSPLAQEVHAWELGRRLAEVDAEYDLALQVHGWLLGQPRPYAVYVDLTRLMAEQGWPTWMPISPRERHNVLDRERRMYLGAGHVFAMGEHARTSLLHDYGVPEDRVSVVGGGVNFDRLPEVTPVPSDPLILFVGKEFERKGGPDLLAAFRTVRSRMPDARLDLVGPRIRIDEPGVTVHGRLSSREVLGGLYRRTRVFCMPSIYEPWGFAFAEAMAYGRPCVGTSVQAIPEMLDHGAAGLLVPPRAPAQLADALEKLLRDDDLANRIGVAARERVEERLTWDHVAERMAPGLISAARL